MAPVSTKHFRSWPPNRAFMKTEHSLWARPHYRGLTPGLETGRPLIVSLTWLAIDGGLEPKLAFPREMSHLSTDKAVIFSSALSIIHSSPVPRRTPTFTDDVTHSPTLITRTPAPCRRISH